MTGRPNTSRRDGPEPLARRARAAAEVPAMALHAPTHHAGFHNEHLLRNAALAVVLGIILVATLGLALNVRVIDTSPSSGISDEQKALIDYRAGERADWAAGATTEIESLIQFRASERSGN